MKLEPEPFRMKTGKNNISVKWNAKLKVDPGELEQAIKNGWIQDGIDGWAVDPRSDGEVIFKPKPNLVVNSGVNISLDRLFNINGPPTEVQTMGVDDGTSNPTASTSSSSTGSTNRRIIAFDSTPIRTDQTVSASGTFTDANVSFVMKRLFLSKASAGTSDSAGDLYSMTVVFTIDLTSFSSFSQTFEAQVTGAGS